MFKKKIIEKQMIREIQDKTLRGKDIFKHKSNEEISMESGKLQIGAF